MPRVALAVAIVVFALPASAQQNIDFSKVEIKTIDLGHNTYRLEGQGGNITVAVGSDGNHHGAPYRTRLHRLNSLLTGKRTGNLAETGLRCRRKLKGLLAEFPTQRNREFLADNREFFSTEIRKA